MHQVGSGGCGLSGKVSISSYCLSFDKHNVARWIELHDPSVESRSQSMFERVTCVT